MQPHDLKSVAHLGQVFWANRNRAEPMTVETLSAVSLLELTDERAVERAARALLDRALREGTAANTFANLGTQAASAPFFRLELQDRFLLVSLHEARWSYARLSRILGISIERVEELAWRARVQLATVTGTAKGNRAYPIGGVPLTSHCPEYDARRPWTQRFLDEEFADGREKLFLQNHLMACDGCRRSLMSCKDVYYAVDAVIPRLEESDAAELVEALKEVTTRSRDLRARRATVSGALRSVFGRFDVQLVVLAIVMIGAIVSAARS